MKKDVKKYSETLIYIRYLLPIFTAIIIFAMFFVPSYRFIFSGEVGDSMSTALLLSNSWEQSRNVLFTTTEQTNMAISFSKVLFVLIIILVLLFLISLAVNVWSAIVAFRCLLNKNDDENSVERDRLVLCVFIPNRIVLSIFTVLTLSISCLPYFMSFVYWFTYSTTVTVVLEAPDSLIVGGVLVLASIVLSIICAPIERKLGVDVFAKDIENDEIVIDEIPAQADSGDIDDESKERIRRLFDDKNKK